MTNDNISNFLSKSYNTAQIVKTEEKLSENYLDIWFNKNIVIVLNNEKEIKCKLLDIININNIEILVIERQVAGRNRHSLLFAKSVCSIDIDV